MSLKKSHSELRAKRNNIRKNLIKYKKNKFREIIMNVEKGRGIKHVFLIPFFINFL